MKRNLRGVHPCRHCGLPVSARYLFHKPCLDEIRRSFDYRTYALGRDGRVCARCPGWYNDLTLRAHQRLGRQRRVDVDHIEPLGAGGPNEPQNLQVLCKHHHRVKTRVDIARMRGTYVGILRRPSALLGITAAVWVLTRLGRVALEAAGSVDAAITLAGVIAWTVLLGYLVYGLRARTLARLRGTVLEVTQDSRTKRGVVRARRWRMVRIPGLRIPRLRPTSVEIRYPHTFPDHKPDVQAELEARVTAKMGGTWYARWNTPADRVLLRCPDPLVAQGGIPWPNAGAATLSLWDPIPVGLGEDGQVVAISLVDSNMLIGGEPGSGKSVAMSMITATAALDPHVVLYGIDGKRVELAPWGPAMERLVHDPADALELVNHLRAVVDMRYDLLLAQPGKRKIEKGDGLDLHVLILDELALYTAAGSKVERERFTEALRDLISRGRAAGVIVVVATQRPSANVVSTDVRDLIGYKWAMRTSTPESSDMILGRGQASAGFSAAKIAASTRGIGLLLAEGALPVRLRSFLLDDRALAALATRAATVRGGRLQPAGSSGETEA